MTPTPGSDADKALNRAANAARVEAERQQLAGVFDAQADHEERSAAADAEAVGRRLVQQVQEALEGFRADHKEQRKNIDVLVTNALDTMTAELNKVRAELDAEREAAAVADAGFRLQLSELRAELDKRVPPAPAPAADPFPPVVVG
jgi:uncharacterized protein YicC (UPF0701 family)